MKFSDFGKHFSGYSSITHLMDDLNEGLSQENVIMLGGGNPASIAEVTVIINKTLRRLMERGEIARSLANYDGPQGNDAFIDTLVQFFNEQYGWNISRQNIALTNGSQSSFFTLFNSFAGTAGRIKRKILLPIVPEYIGYNDLGVEDNIITSQQPKISLLENQLFKYEIDFEHLEVDETTGMICVSRPTNPSGNVLSDAECQHLDEIARSSDVPLLVDNAYGTPFPNIIFRDVQPFWNDNTIVCMTLSKLGLPGARTGIVIANVDIIKQFSNMTAITSLAPGSIGPVVVNQMMRDKVLLPMCDQVIRPFYQQRCNYALQLLIDEVADQRLHIHKPEGALFLWLWFEGLGITTAELYQRLKQKGLLIVPGEYFFPGQEDAGEHGKSCIRMNYVQSEQDMKKGIEILANELRVCWESR